jgi:hypothetical protein
MPHMTSNGTEDNALITLAVWVEERTYIIKRVYISNLLWGVHLNIVLLAKGDYHD